MKIGLGQILLILLVILLLFGKFPHIIKDLLQGVTNLRRMTTNEQKKRIEDKTHTRNE